MKKLNIGVDMSNGKDYSMVAVMRGNKIENIAYDELMSIRWYKNPIKYFQYRKVIKQFSRCGDKR